MPSQRSLTSPKLKCQDFPPAVLLPLIGKKPLPEISRVSILNPLPVFE